MAKRSARSVRTVRAALNTPAARANAEHALAQPPVPMLPALLGLGKLDGSFAGQGINEPDQSGQIGAAGTLNLWGFISTEDYNPDLDGFPMFPKYDQMRRGDAQVHASLQQIKLPFKAARKIIKPASDNPQDLAIADFVTESLLADGAFKRPFEQVLDSALLRFDFGAAAEEIIWAVREVESGDVPSDARAMAQLAADRGCPLDLFRRRDGVWTLDATPDEASEWSALLLKGGLYLAFHDLASRLPKTFYRWLEYPDGPREGDLQVLQQFAPKHGRYGFYNIPADRLVRHTNQLEGSNYYGRSILRAAYPHWFWKQQLYRIDAIKHDRVGAGIFLAELTADYKASAAPLAKIEETLRGLRSHDQSYAVQPYGVKYTLLTPQAGSTGNQDLIHSIEHHNQMIAANVLQQFSTQGQQRHGSFSQARVTHDAFYDALQGQAIEISAEFTAGAIRPLCDANFDMRGRNYPRFDFADLASADVNAISDNIAKLAMAKVITPEDDIENWLRELHDAPMLPEEMQGRDRSSVVVPGKPVPDAGPTPVPADEDKNAPSPVDAATRAPHVERGRSFGRVPTAFERRVMDLHGIPDALDTQHAYLTTHLAAIRKRQLKTVAAKVAKKDARNTAAFTDIRHRNVSMPEKPLVLKAIRDAQQRAYSYGRQTVRDELSRQGAMLKLAADDPTAAANQKTATSALVSSAQITARRQIEIWYGRILDTATRLRRSGLQGDALAAAIEQKLADEAISGAKRDASQEINEAFGIGRAAELGINADQIESVTYSAILDANTCDTCRDLDGEEFDVDSAEYFDNTPPNRNCSGGDSCRCVYLAVVKQEAA